MTTRISPGKLAASRASSGKGSRRPAKARSSSAAFGTSGRSSAVKPGKSGFVTTSLHAPRPSVTRTKKVLSDSAERVESVSFATASGIPVRPTGVKDPAAKTSRSKVSAFGRPLPKIRSRARQRSSTNRTPKDHPASVHRASGTSRRNSSSSGESSRKRGQSGRKRKSGASVVECAWGRAASRNASAVRPASGFERMTSAAG